jgi:hypothetical protein
MESPAQWDRLDLAEIRARMEASDHPEFLVLKGRME